MAFFLFRKPAAKPVLNLLARFRRGLARLPHPAQRGASKSPQKDQAVVTVRGWQILTLTSISIIVHFSSQ
jgi:hypothetical protein